jgi:hypothetical protein
MVFCFQKIVGFDPSRSRPSELEKSMYQLSSGEFTATFSTQMELMYQENMLVLGKRYTMAGAFDKALVLLKEGLDYDETRAAGRSKARGRPCSSDRWRRKGRENDGGNDHGIR